VPRNAGHSCPLIAVRDAVAAVVISVSLALG